MYKDMNVRLTGATPLLLHSNRAANPLDPDAKKMKTLSRKRDKTDEDLEKLSELEWFLSLYIGDDGQIVMPGENIEAMFIAAAKKEKKGTQAKVGFLCNTACPISYAGPKKPQELLHNRHFVDVRAVRIQKNTVMRTRPIFREWHIDARLSFDPTQFNDASAVLGILKVGGEYIGLGDYRPKYGRFTAEIQK